MTDTVKPVYGKRHRMRNGAITGPVHNDGGDQPDHCNDGRYSWHLDGTYCGVNQTDRDLVEVLD